MARNTSYSRVFGLDRGALDPYRMEDEAEAALRTKLEPRVLPERDSSYIDIFFTKWQGVLSCVGTFFAVLFACGPTGLSGEVFAAALVGGYALWIRNFRAVMKRHRAAKAKLNELDNPERLFPYSTALSYTMESISDDLRSLPRDLREQHRELWDNAVAAANVLKFGEDEAAWDLLEDAERKAGQLKDAHDELERAVEADRREVEFQTARAVLSSATRNAHEAAQHEALAMLEGASSLRSMTKALHESQA